MILLEIPMMKKELESHKIRKNSINIKSRYIKSGELSIWSHSAKVHHLYIDR